MNDKMREQFEAWMTNTAKIIIGSSDPYPAGLERDAWRVWQAAYAAGVAAERERAAGVCESEARLWEADGNGPSVEARLCAARIRSAAAIRKGEA